MDRRLAPVRASHPFQVEGPQEDNFGVALYSRIPLRDAHVAYLRDAPVPSILADVLGAHLVLTHPVPPLGREWAGMRDAHLRSVASRMDARTVVLGDLNATPWSAAFPGPAVGWRPGTWPAPFPGIFRIPIDHVLVGDAIGLTSLAVGPFVGSDHRPLIADIVVPDR